MFTPEAIAGYLVTAILTIINLLVGYLILKRFLFKPVLRFIRRRQADVRNKLAEAETNLNQARELREQADQEVESARKEATRIVAEARGAAQHRADTIAAQAKAESAAIIEKGHVECDRMRTAVLEGMRGEVADLSVRIASRVLEKYMDADRQRDLVEEFLDQELTAATVGKGDRDADQEESHE